VGKKIDIDEDFITNLQSRLNTISGEVQGVQLGNNPANTTNPTPSGGAIKDLHVEVGAPSFPIGVGFKNFVKTNATALDTRLSTHHTMLTEFVADITDMLDNTDHIESLNSTSISDVQTYFPNSTPPPSTGNPGT
jgi:hypothetical protein